MSWQETHKKDSTSSSTISGTCHQSGKMAEVTTFYRESMDHKADIQKTPHFLGYRCSLQRTNGFADPACMDTCPLIQKQRL